MLNIRAENKQPAKVYRDCVLYTTISPCPMYSGAMMLYGIKKVIIGENITFMGDEELLRLRGVETEVLQDETCIILMKEFIEKTPGLLNGDIGE